MIEVESKEDAQELQVLLGEIKYFWTDVWMLEADPFYVVPHFNGTLKDLNRVSEMFKTKYWEMKNGTVE
jgi:hypothetical protein